ncbi:hypothetical protein GEV29_02835 [Aeromicrobium sp. SMF47]|uniref:phospholipase D-like domain-containing protein n=1 Tax=Aeromicrobium yanjiei TaxID=2662028 RepID=UPI00129D56DB|nr:phospholipase D-like domain-containing protein [Aeromicrobium yanjiei]MRJ75461.1 hypothetical protein [Aeromicrobium yanjiei]
MDERPDRAFRAIDVYPTWKRLIDRAETSVRVFTPYFDHQLPRLLGNTDLDVDSIAVITDLSPESGTRTYRKQLQATKLLLQQGIEVRTLARLHAKVLLTDERWAVVGSQNYTSYARKSKEVSVGPIADMAGSPMLVTLSDWRAQSIPVSIEFIDSLLDKISAELAEVVRLQDDLQNDFDDVLGAWLAAQRREADRVRRSKQLERAIRHAAQSSAFRHAQQSAFVRAKPVERADGTEYMSLAVFKDADLTQWRNPSSGNRVRTKQLERLSYHPMIVAHSGRMAFVRLAKRRISFFKSSVRFMQPRVVDGLPLWISLTMPERDTGHHNLQVTLSERPGTSDAWVFELMFDGASVRLVDHRARTERREQQVRRVRDAGLKSFEQVDRADELVADLLAPIRFDRMNIESPNIDGLLPRGWNQLRLVHYSGSHVLVATSANGQ